MVRIWIRADYWEQFKQQRRMWDKELQWQGSAFYIPQVEDSLSVTFPTEDKVFWDYRRLKYSVARLSEPQISRFSVVIKTRSTLKISLVPYKI